MFEPVDSTRDRRRSSARAWGRAALVGAVLGALLACFMMSAALQHNPQQEFADEAGVKVAALGIIGLAWFVPPFVLVTIIARVFLFSAGRR